VVRVIAADTRVRITGNHRTKPALLGRTAVVITYLANGWHRVRLEGGVAQGGEVRTF
jgi:membrane protein implicated in regulation of membrane protease activity